MCSPFDGLHDLHIHLWIRQHFIIHQNIAVSSIGIYDMAIHINHFEGNMAFGFPAYHTELYQPLVQESLNDSIERVLALMGWEVSMSQQDLLIIKSSVSFWSWGEKITIRYLSDKNLEIRSECALPTQCFDWGKNKENVQKFLTQLSLIERQKMGNA